MPGTPCRSGSSTSSPPCTPRQGRPRDLTTVRVVGIGDFADRGFSQLGLPGLMRRTIGSNIGNEPRLGALVETERARVVLVPAGRALAAHARDRRGAAGAGHARRAGHVRRPAPDRREAERPHDRGSRRGRDAARQGMAAVPRLPDRRRRHPRHDRRRGRQPHDGGRGGPGRDARDGDGRAEQRRDRHRPGPPAGAARQPAAARRQGAGRARRPRLRRPRPVADVHHPGLAVLRGRLRKPVDGRAAAAARRAQDHRPPLAARVPAGRDLQPRLRHQPAHRPGRVGGGDHRPARAHRRAGHLRRRAGRRQRGRRRVQLPGDDRPAVHVRLLRRRRARRRQPVVRGGRRRGQRQRPRVRGPRPRARRLPEHQRPDAAHQLRRHAHGAGARARHRRRRRSRRAAKGRCSKFVPQVREISFNGRLARERGQQVRYITDRAVFELRRRRRVADRGRAGHRRGARRPRPDGLPAAGRRGPADDRPRACTPAGPMGLAADFGAAS